MVYLDYAANTPVDLEVLDLFYDVTKKYYGNPNSVHQVGRESKMQIDKATERIADLLGVLKEEIIYTSGATESNNLAIKGICERYKNYGKHIILSSLEHNSIISSANIMQEAGFDVDLIPINKDGLIDIDALKSMIREDTILVSVCSVDSEIGLIQPIKEIGELLKDYPHTYFHTDATQAIGKVDIDFSNADLITIAPHKFYGLNGIGILIKKKGVNLKPIIHGGRSTTVFRSGTPIVSDIVASSFALEKAIKNREERYNYVSKLNKIVREFLEEYSFIHINNTSKCIPFTLNFSINGVNARYFVDMLDKKGVCVSAKTSCCPLETPSKLVYALTKDKKLASSSVRVSFSHLTKLEEIDIFKDVFKECIKELKENGKI